MTKNINSTTNRFQSTLPYGSDVFLPTLAPVVIAFQSTLPYGSDNAGSVKISDNMIFQSTLPYGSDYDKLYDAINHDISIHAPLRERLMSIFVGLLSLAFQSTLPYGSDFRCRWYCWPCFVYFNPRSLTGATQFLFGK